MNKRLKMLLEKNKKRKFEGGELLDCYDQVVVEDISITITTRISASCNYFIVVKDENRN